MTQKRNATLAKARVYGELNSLENSVKVLRSKFEEADRSTNEEVNALERERDELRGSRDNALAELVRVLELKEPVIHYKDLVGHVQKLKDELEKERDKNAGYVYITAPEGIARAQGRKLERERIIGLVRERTNGHHAGSKLDCLACTEDFAIISLLERGE